ncbi:MAG: hypothetical protein AAB037_04975, partial [Chloroflexota bacterium]
CFAVRQLRQSGGVHAKQPGIFGRFPTLIKSVLNFFAESGVAAGFGQRSQGLAGSIINLRGDFSGIY